MSLTVNWLFDVLVETSVPLNLSASIPTVDPDTVSENACAEQPRDVQPVGQALPILLTAPTHVFCSPPPPVSHDWPLVKHWHAPNAHEFCAAPPLFGTTPCCKSLRAALLRFIRRIIRAARSFSATRRHLFAVSSDPQSSINLVAIFEVTS